MAMFIVEKLMMIENFTNFNDNVLDKFTNNKDGKMKVIHKFNRK
jgi:hypothetical protein